MLSIDGEHLLIGDSIQPFHYFENSSCELGICLPHFIRDYTFSDLLCRPCILTLHFYDFLAKMCALFNCLVFGLFFKNKLGH